MGTGVPPGLQNQSLGVSSVLGGFDSHILPPTVKKALFQGLFLYIIRNMLGSINDATQQAVEFLQKAKKPKDILHFLHWKHGLFCRLVV